MVEERFFGIQSIFLEKVQEKIQNKKKWVGVKVTVVLMVEDED